MTFSTPISFFISSQTGTDLYIFLRSGALAMGISLGIILPIIGMVKYHSQKKLIFIFTIDRTSQKSSYQDFKGCSRHLS